MSLNRNEQMVFDYLQSNPDEKSHWLDKVRAIAAGEADGHSAAVVLARELWAYYEERAGVASPFREMAAREGLKPTSMRNLAEYLLRIWVAPKPGRKRPPADSPEDQ